MTRTVIAKKIKVDYAHALLHTKTKCNLIHGHTATVIFYFTGKKDKKTGMLIDFSDLKNLLYNAVIRFIDHNIIVNVEDYELKKQIEKRNPNYLELDCEPTAENLAKYCFEMVEIYLNTVFYGDLPIELVKVEWYETETNCAIYEKVVA